VARPRRAIEQLPPFEPAAAAAHGMIRLATNESPYGPFPAARAALADHLDHVSRYPELDGVLIERLAALHEVPGELVALGNGADAIIGYISSAYLEAEDEVVTGWPSFPTYLTDADKQGAIPQLVALRDGALDLDAIAERIGPQTKIAWICSPNNPTGGAVTRDALSRFIEAVPEHVLVIIDEAYYEYAAGPDHVDAIKEHVQNRPNVGALRTFSKIYGLAALRVGYFVGPAPVAATLGKLRHYYDVSELANVAALASLEEPDELEQRRRENERGRARLEAGLAALGLRWNQSRANFLAVDVGDAESVAMQLFQDRVATRPLTSLGAPELLRVAVGTDEQIDRVLALLSKALP
jgi:histidinol-phosphate aminotransferase